MLPIILTLLSVQTTQVIPQKCVINSAWLPDHAPYTFQGNNRKGEGYDVAFIKAVGKKLNCHVNLPLRSWGRQHKFAIKGRQDVILSSMDWDENVDYFVSAPYRTDPIGFYWRKTTAEKHTGKTLKQLLESNLKISYWTYAHRNQEQKDILNNPRLKRNFFANNNKLAPLQNLQKDRVDGVYIHLAVAEQFFKKHGRENFIINKQLSYEAPISFLLAKKSTLGASFLDRMNQAIETLSTDGTKQALTKEYLTGYTLD